MHLNFIFLIFPLGEISFFKKLYIFNLKSFKVSYKVLTPKRLYLFEYSY